MSKIALEKNEENYISSVLEKLAAYYPHPKTGLVYDNPYQLFVATVLSAQTTDEQVNRITEKLFAAVPSAFELSRIKPSELEPFLKSCGLYRHKSKHLVNAAKMIVEQHNGRVPDSFDDLLKLPGVGRKTASVIISSAFGKPALAVDTHVFRVSRRLGLADGATVNLVESQLKKVIPMDIWSNAHHQLIAHGRSICHARKPLCSACFLKNICLYAEERGNVDDLGKTKR